MCHRQQDLAAVVIPSGEEKLPLNEELKAGGLIS